MRSPPSLALPACPKRTVRVRPVAGFFTTLAKRFSVGMMGGWVDSVPRPLGVTDAHDNEEQSETEGEETDEIHDYRPRRTIDLSARLEEADRSRQFEGLLLPPLLRATL